LTEANMETEIKLALSEPLNHVRRKLRSAGLRIKKGRIFETNELFDSDDQRLRNRGELIRIRRVGKNSILTYKGPSHPGDYKSREEIETSLGDAAKAELILARLGFRPVFRYEKYRTEYSKPGENGTVTLDETPIGDFLEIEAEPAWIDGMAGRLGYSRSQYITKSYAGLYLDYCRERGTAPSNLIFDPSYKK
jgi:adenylate cyclase class 2